MPEQRKHLTLSIQARCATLAAAWLRLQLGCEQKEGVLRGLTQTMLAAVAFAFQEYPELEAGPEPTPAEKIHVPMMPAFVATRGDEPGVLVTRAWEAGYRAGVLGERFLRSVRREGGAS
jgi:hypothetical protein